MKIHPVYTAVFNHYSYCITHNHEAVVIDPVRDTASYSSIADTDKSEIRNVLETALHDFYVTGNRELQRQYGAQIHVPEGASVSGKSHNPASGDCIRLGEYILEYAALPESGKCIYILKTSDLQPLGLFTGEHFLSEILQKQLAEIPLYPGLGAGNSRNFSPGMPLKNYPMNDVHEQQIHNPVPDDYAENLMEMNSKGPSAISEITGKSKAFSADELAEEIKNGTLVIDTREPENFGTCFIPGSLSLPLNGKPGLCIPFLLDADRRVAIVSEPGTEMSGINMLLNAGVQQIAGWLQGGMNTWTAAGKKTDMIICIDAEEFLLDHTYSSAKAIDARNADQFAKGSIPDAVNVPLAMLSEALSKAGTEEEIHVFSQSGCRSITLASWLKMRGYPLVKNVLGGYASILQIQMPEVLPYKGSGDSAAGEFDLSL
ncbi:MAG: hypothetical protein JNL57_13980 [Bacteroidetes bacterium]|nr:hypothetical protein [Bacteroidota bacterium]